MNIVSYGAGINSTAMLIGLHQKGIPIDLILFADPGGEQPYTYEYLPIMECPGSRPSTAPTKTGLG